jgi:hypothetical protein
MLIVLTAAEQDQMRKHRSDQHRLYYRPIKSCVVCGREMPNTHGSFAAGKDGRLRSTCLDCAAKVRQVRKVNRPEKECRCCGEKARLYRDRGAPKIDDDLVMLCRKCLLTTNFMVTADDATVANWLDYRRWRQGVLK